MMNLTKNGGGDGSSCRVVFIVIREMHITPNIGIMASISDEAYLVKAFDTQRNDYRNKLIHDLGINIGVCFQINGW